MTVTKMSPDREERRRRQKELADQLKESGALDGIFAKIDAGEPLTGQDGLLGGMLKAALERGLETELTEHVGYERGAADASLFPNSRNGTSPKTVATEIGDIELAMPRDRNGTFTPMLVAKGQRRLDGLDGKALLALVDQLKNKLGSAVILLGGEFDGKVVLVAGVTQDLTGKLKAGELMKRAAAAVGGKGGGRPDMAQGGGVDAGKLGEALALVEPFVAAAG